MEKLATHELSLNDFLNFFPTELERQAGGKPILVVSDFDETLCSAYVFSRRWNTHVPKIRRDLSLEAGRLVYPMCIATARTATEPVSWVLWHKLSRFPMPLVAENGAVLVWPSEKVTQQPKMEILATNEQRQLMKEIQQKLLTGKIGDLQVPNGHEIVLHPGRIATLELRTQEIHTKKGTPHDYNVLIPQLEDMLVKDFPFIEIVSSGNSIDIQPKGINKGLGIETALARVDVSCNDIFLLGLGDSINDGALFNFVKQMGGLTIGVRLATEGLSDFTIDGGDRISLEIIKVVNQLAT